METEINLRKKINELYAVLWYINVSFAEHYDALYDGYDWTDFVEHYNELSPKDWGDLSFKHCMQSKIKEVLDENWPNEYRKFLNNLDKGKE